MVAPHPAAVPDGEPQHLQDGSMQLAVHVLNVFWASVSLACAGSHLMVPMAARNTQQLSYAASSSMPNCSPPVALPILVMLL
jgi:hypothetical protein